MSLKMYFLLYPHIYHVHCTGVYAYFTYIIIICIFTIYFSSLFSVFTSFSFQLFDKLRKERPLELNKVIPINGDITSDELGISESDQVNKILILIICNIFYIVSHQPMNQQPHFIILSHKMFSIEISLLYHKSIQNERFKVIDSSSGSVFSYDQS